ncbi:unnamed protein product [Mytilus coruscus]|uniref:Uncharacterized protein n=1 Tax=Mytilus coruscus TaxID=42192 RepID=A0A6J8EKW1_MYTCO|nr:unnamed protein product [Mytilus coruscus]
MRSVKTSGGMTRGKGMTEVQRAKWLLSMPACSGINSAMQTVENLQYTTSEQHKESTKSRQERDNKYVLTILSYLRERNPFSESLDLRNIETGVTATDEVNVHNTELVGKKIIESMKDQDAFSISFKRSMQVKTLNEKTKIRTQGGTLNDSSQLLIQRLITAAKHVTDDVSKIFSYELSNFPSAMFDTSVAMREPQKSNLVEALWAIGDCSAEYETSTTDVQYVLDGGSLLHRIQWPRGVTFGRIADLYVDHVCRKYNTAIVVFDGYGNGPSTKDPTHQRQTKESDADVSIVQTAVESAKSTMTVLIGVDTDLLVLLCYHMNFCHHNIIFQSEMKQSTKKFKVWDLKKTKNVLGEEFRKVLPFVHSISGCDTTSRLFGIGKGQAVKKAQTDAYFMECANTFTDTMSKEEVLRIGEEVIVCLYNEVEHEGLDLIRFRKFTSKVMTSSKFVESLLQTLCSANEKSGYGSLFRTFLSDNNIDLKLTTFHGHRINLLFAMGASVFFHKDNIYELIDLYFEKENRNNLLKANYVKNSMYLAGCRAFGIVDKLFTGPLWRIIENADHILDLNQVWEQFKGFLEIYSQDATDLVEGKILYTNYTNIDEIFDCLFSVEDEELNILTTEALQIILLNFQLILERQLSDCLPGGILNEKTDGIDINLREQSKSVATTNIISERDFAHLDRLQREKPNANLIALEELDKEKEEAIGTWVAVAYQSGWFPGEVTEFCQGKR